MACRHLYLCSNAISELRSIRKTAGFNKERGKDELHIPTQNCCCYCYSKKKKMLSKLLSTQTFVEMF